MSNIPRETFVEIHKLMPIVCVDCVIFHNGKILLVKRKQEPMSGAWWFPGGRLLRGEKLSQAAARLAKEEVSVNISQPICLGYDETEFKADPFNHNEGTHTINFVYAAEVSALSIVCVTLDDNHTTHSMFTFEEIYQNDMHPYIKRFAALTEGVFK